MTVKEEETCKVCGRSTIAYIPKFRCNEKSCKAIVIIAKQLRGLVPLTDKERQVLEEIANNDKR